MDLNRYHSNDKSVVIHLFKTVFTAADGPDEGRIVSQLVERITSETPQEDYLSFTAKDQGELCAAIFMTRLFFEKDIKAFLLSPVAVAVTCQRQGLGQRLINYGIEALKREDVSLLFTYGDPRYYGRLGFNQISEALIKAPYRLSQPEGWLAQSLDGRTLEPIAETMRCVKAFDNPALW